MELKKLSDYFPMADIEFRVGNRNKAKTKALALPYITNRAIQQRLDEVCGPENWKNEFKEWKGDKQLCGISIKIDGEWVTKWDGAEDTNFQGVKGGLSDSMKRAAVQWGIGRYLYKIPAQWHDIVNDKFTKAPTLPKQYIPDGDKTKVIVDIASKEEIEIINDILPVFEYIDERQQKKLEELIFRFDLSTEKICEWANVSQLKDLTKEQFETFLTTLDKKYKGVRFEYTEVGGKE